MTPDRGPSSPKIQITPYIRFDASWRWPPHQHGSAEIDLLLDGACELSLPGGECLPLRAGDALVLPPYLLHGFAASPGGCAFCIVHAEGLRDGLIRRATPEGRASSHALSPAGRRAFTTMAVAIERELTIDDDVAADVAIARVVDLFALVLRERRQTSEASSHHDEEGRRYVDQALAFLNANPDPQCDVAHLAREAHLSSTHLRRLFHRYLGLSPKAYLQQRRLTLAKGLLTETNLPVAAIAQRLGFAAPHHFTSAFAKAEGMPPSLWRKARRSLLVPPTSLD